MTEDRQRSVALEAAVTIVALNYLPLARTLCDSFLEHHPSSRFFVLVVDRPSSDFNAAAERFETIFLDEISLPRDGLFPYQYSILELSTAVKPFILSHLLSRFDFENITYLDPDLFVTNPLASVKEALAEGSIVLTPHMMSPPPDDERRPTETDIMLSGTFNLGFISICNDQNSREMLEWWKDRLTNRCVVDLANGLFVDQRWMDLAPSYFDRVVILKLRTVNVAYWNLHERRVSLADSGYTVDGSALEFFHFSGFDPRVAAVLSKHQDRFHSNATSGLAALTLEYAGRLIRNGYCEWVDVPSAFARLANGVTMNRHTQWVIRQVIERHLPCPNPTSSPDDFCRFMMTPHDVMHVRGVAPLVASIEHFRPDVRHAYGPAFDSPAHAEVLRVWLQAGGAREEQITPLFEKFGPLLDRMGVCRRAVDLWRQSAELQSKYPRAFASVAAVRQYAAWIEDQGVADGIFDSGDGGLLIGRRHGLVRPLMLYLQDSNLQDMFRCPFLASDRGRYVDWLYEHAVPRGIVHSEEVAWFEGYAQSDPDSLAAIVLSHAAGYRRGADGNGSLFGLEGAYDVIAANGVRPSSKFLHQLYTSLYSASLLVQVEQYGLSRGGLASGLRGATPDAILTCARRGLVQLKQFEGLDSFFRCAPSSPVRRSWLNKTVARLGANAGLDGESNRLQETVLGGLKDELEYARRNCSTVNIAGYLTASSGMGESSRSMMRTMCAAGIPSTAFPLPSVQYRLGDGEIADEMVKVLGHHDPFASVNIIVANGDEYSRLRRRLPPALFQNRINIGYWVWETERLPDAHAQAPGLDEIWTPSRYSATAIRAALPSKTIRTLPHALDLDLIDAATISREAFGLPSSGTLFGYFFDCKSVLERKNPIGLIQAFRMAFGSSTASDAPALVLKVGSPEAAPQQMSRLRKAAEGLRVIWMTDDLSRLATLSLMKTIDVYVSLHRSEGFGLTMAEAMAMGKPVVATRYSGNLDFMTDFNSLLVEANVTVTERDHGPYVAGTRWADPDLSVAARLMADLNENGTSNYIAAQAATTIRHDLNPTHLGAIARKWISEMTQEYESIHHGPSSRD